MSRILVVGASGFLGRHLVPVLESNGHVVDKVNSDNMLMPNHYDQIYHLAAHTQAGDWCLTHGGEQWLRNQEINTKVLSFWREHSPKAKLITIGSSCAYAPDSELREENYMLGQPHESLYTYAMTKRMLYEGCRALNKQYGMNYLYLVPATLYGPNYHTDGRQAHFIFDLIRKIIRAKELGEHAILWGDGNQTREVMYVEDFVWFMLKLADNRNNQILNGSTGKGHTIKHFAEVICGIVGYDPSKLIYNVNGFVGVKDKTLVAKWDYQWTPLADGVRKTVDWYYASESWK